MTIICALHEKGRVWIGSDSLVTGADVVLGNAEKWVERDGWAIGSAGHYRTNCLLSRNADALFKHLDGQDDFVERVRELIRDDDYTPDDESGPKAYGQNFILAHRSGVWSVSISFSLVQISEGRLWAEGSGWELGIGAGNLENERRSAENRVRAAVYAAINNSVYCGGEIMVREVQ